MTAQEKRLVIAKVLKKSVLAIFKTHTYSFGQIISTNWSQINLLHCQISDVVVG